MRRIDFRDFAVWSSTTVKYLGSIELLLGICLLLPTGMAAILGEDYAPFLTPVPILITMGGLQFVLFRDSESFKPVNGLLLIALAWLTLFVIGTIPYALYGLPLLDSMFESVSGFTTTGASIIPDPTAMPVSLMVWRSFTQWVGGITVILVFMYMMPMVGIGRAVLINELAGSGSTDYTLKLQKAAVSFILVYSIFTIANYLIIIALGVNPVDSLCLTFATISTGGFLNTVDSLASYSPPVKMVTALFMFLGGVNFYLHYNAIVRRQRGVYRKNSEFKFNVVWFLLAAGVFFAMMLMNTDVSKWGDREFIDLIETSLFSVVSMGTSTGVTIGDASQFPAQCVTILLVVGFIGASSGSTSGGIKIGRLNVIYQFMKVTISRTLHPNAIRDVRVDDQIINHAAVLSAFSIMTLFMVTMLSGSVIIMMAGCNILDSINISIAMVGNLGTGFGYFGPNGSFCDLGGITKVIMMLLMWVGRLEILTALVFFAPSFWKELWTHHARKTRWKKNAKNSS